MFLHESKYKFLPGLGWKRIDITLNDLTPYTAQLLFVLTISQLYWPTLPTKVRLVKAMVFPVVMYECESWTVNKAERRRIDAFELWCWRRLLRVPWTARRSNQSILKEISPGIYLGENSSIFSVISILFQPNPGRNLYFDSWRNIQSEDAK